MGESGTSQPEEQPSSDPHRPVMAERLRDARARSGMSARQLALQVGCSASLISQIERGKAAPSVSRLYSIATALGVSMDSLFPEADTPAPGPPDEPGTADDIVVRCERRSVISLERGVRWERLTPQSERSFEFREVFYQPGGGSPDTERAIQHNGRDYAVIIEGVLTAQIGFDRFVLRPGDSIAFDATIPHLFWNQGSERVRAVFALTDRA